MFNFFIKTLSRKLLIIFIAISIIPIILISYLMYSGVRDDLEKESIEAHDQLVVQKIQIMKEFTKRYISLVQLSSEFPPIQGLIRSADDGVDHKDNSSYEAWAHRLQSIFKSIVASDPNVYQIRFIDETGWEKVRVNSLKNGNSLLVDTDELQDKSQSEYFKIALKLPQGGYYISPITLNEEHGRVEKPYVPVMRFSVPVLDERNQSRKGVVVINVRTSAMFDELKHTQYGETVLINQDGFFLLHPEIEKEFSFQLSANYNYFNEEKELKNNLMRFNEKRHYDEESGGYRTWRKFKYDPNNAENYLVLFSNVHESELFATIYKMRSMIILISCLLLAVVLGLAFFVAKSIVQPISQLEILSNQIASGDLTVNIDERLTSMEDEVGSLSRSFKSMVTNLNSLITKVGQAINEITSSATEIASISQEQGAGVAEQSSAIAETTAAAKELSVSSEKVSDNIHGVMQVNDKALAGMSKVKEVVEKLSMKINILNDKSAEIGKITNVIDDVADQTNLLAINASIEAARAGEQGKGFTVVADEIRKLSDSTGKSTKDITALIEIIQHEISNGLLVMEECARIAEDQLQLTNESVFKSKEISISSTEQMAGAQQIANAMASINDAMKQVNEAARQSQDAARQLDILGSELKKSAEQFKINRA